jgi:hypothetical protein
VVIELVLGIIVGPQVLDLAQVNEFTDFFASLGLGMLFFFAGYARRVRFVAAQIQTTSYSPRLAARLRRDPVIIAGLALPTATATYSLVELAPHHPGPSVVVDAGGTPRAIVPAPRWSEYVELGLVEIRRYGHESPQIVRRLTALYDRLGEVADDTEQSRIELERRLLREAVAQTFPDDEERALIERPDRLGLGGAG